MLEHEVRDDGILILKPQRVLRDEDFAALAAAVDPLIERHGRLEGLLVGAPSFPGWQDFAGLISHLRFVRDHHRRIRRIAVVSDSAVLAVAPKLASHFVNAEVRTFAAADRAAALA
jgi:SpoIIAA-like